MQTCVYSAPAKSKYKFANMPRVFYKDMQRILEEWAIALHGRLLIPFIIFTDCKFRNKRKDQIKMSATKPETSTT